MIVWVTGATGNVGFGTARAARKAGAMVVAPVRASAAVQRVRQDLGDEGVFVPVVDTTDEASLRSVVDDAVRRFGQLDAVFAPMGAWWHGGASLDQPPHVFRQLLQTFVEAQWLLVKATAPALRASKGSYTLVCGTAGGGGHIPGSGLMAAAVSGQWGLSRVLREELIHEPFRFNELRISCRIERHARLGVVTAEEAGQDFLALFSGNERGVIFSYPGKGRLAVSQS